MQSVVADVLAQFERAVPSRNSRIALAGLGLVSSYILLRKVLPTRFLSSKGKAVLVTGCDTPLGFGTAIARRLHQLGYVVFAGCLNAEEAKKTVHADQAGSSTFHVIQLDVTNQAQIDKAVVEVEAWLAANPEFRKQSLIVLSILNVNVLQDCSALLTMQALGHFRHLSGFKWIRSSRCSKSTASVLSR